MTYVDRLIEELKGYTQFVDESKREDYTDCVMAIDLCRDFVWETGRPRDEGEYLVYMDKHCPRYSLLHWDRDVMWGLPNPDLVMAWIKIDPPKEK